MKKISKALSVLCSMTTFACMLGTNPAIAMVRDDGAAAAGEPKPEADGNNRSVADLRKIFEAKAEAAKAEAEAAEARAAAAKAKAKAKKEEAEKAKAEAAKAEAKAKKEEAEKAAARAERAARAAEAEASKAITRSRQAAERAAEAKEAAAKAKEAERKKLEQEVEEATAKKEAARKVLEEAEKKERKAKKENQEAARAARRATAKAREEYEKCSRVERAAIEMSMRFQFENDDTTGRDVPPLPLKKPPVGDSPAKNDHDSVVDVPLLPLKRPASDFPATDDHDSVVKEVRDPKYTLIWVKSTKKDFEESLARIREISGQDSEFGIGKIFGEMIPRFEKLISRLGKLEETLIDVKTKLIKDKQSDVDVDSDVLALDADEDARVLVNSIFNELKLIGDSRLECNCTAGRKIVELIYSKSRDLGSLIATKPNLICPEVWTAGFLSLLKSHGVKELDPKGDWGPSIFYGIMDNTSDMKSPVFCALLAFAECVKQVDEEQNCGLLGNTIDLHIEMAKILDLLFNKVDKPIEGVDEFYKTMDPDGTPSKYGTKKMRFLGCWIRLNSKAVESK